MKQIWGLNFITLEANEKKINNLLIVVSYINVKMKRLKLMSKFLCTWSEKRKGNKEFYLVIHKIEIRAI